MTKSQILKNFMIFLIVISQFNIFQLSTILNHIKGHRIKDFEGAVEFLTLFELLSLIQFVSV